MARDDRAFRGDAKMELDLTTPEGRKKQGELILQAIKEAGLSVEQVAKDIGCSRALLYQYIAGTTLAQPDKLTLIARRTGKPLWFFYGADLTQTDALQTEREALRRERMEWEQQLAEERTKQLRERLDNLFALANAQTSPPDWKSAASTYEQIITLARTLGDETAEAKALFWLGNLRLLTGDLDGAVSALRQAQGLFEKQRNYSYAFACRQSIGRALLLMGRPEEARQQFEVVSQSENWYNRWEATVALAAVDEWTGDFRSAMEHLGAAEELSTKAPTERDAKFVLMFVAANRANVYLACGDFVEAEKLAKSALTIAEQLGDSDQQLEALLTIAVCQRHLGRWVDAYENSLRAMTLASFANDQERVIVAKTVLAQLLAIVGDFPQAKARAKDALTEALKLRSRRTEIWAHKSLAETYLREGNPDDAYYHAQVSVELSESMQHSAEFAHALCLRAWSNLLRGKIDEAVQDLERAFSIADEKGMRYIAALAAWLKAEIYIAQGDNQSEKWLTSAERLASEIGDADLNYQCLVTKSELTLKSGHEQEAIDVLTKAHELLSGWRLRWRAEGYDDTWLEDMTRFKASLILAQLIAKAEGKDRAEKFVESVGWIPLKEAWVEFAEPSQLNEPKQRARTRKRP